MAELSPTTARDLQAAHKRLQEADKRLATASNKDEVAKVAEEYLDARTAHQVAIQQADNERVGVDDPEGVPEV